MVHITALGTSPRAPRVSWGKHPGYGMEPFPCATRGILGGVHPRPTMGAPPSFPDPPATITLRGSSQGLEPRIHP